MKIKTNSIILSLVMIFTTVHNATTVDIQCEFRNDDFDSIANQFSCQVQVNLRISSRNTEITAIHGNLGYGKSINDVTGFSIKDKNIQYMPRNLGDKFKNLIAIRIRQGRLKEVIQDDLKPFTRLRYLNLDANDIEVLDDNLFEYNLQLEVVWFEGNRIKLIGITTFDSLQKLRDLDLKSNNCVSKRASSRSEVISLVSRIKQTCVNVELDFKKIKGKYKELSQENQNLKTESDRLKIQILNRNTEITGLKTSISNLTSEILRGQQTIKEINVQIQEKNNKINILESGLSNMTNLHQKLLIQFQETEMRVHFAVNETSKIEEEFQSKINDLQYQIQQKDLQFMNLSEKCMNTQVMLGKNQEKLMNVQESLKTIKESEETLKKHAAELVQQLETKEIEQFNLTDILFNNSMMLQEYESEINVLKSQIDESMLNFKELESEKINLASQLNDMSNKKQLLDMEVKNLTEKLQESQIELENLLTTNTELSEELSKHAENAEALTKHAEHSNGNSFVVLGLALIIILTIINIVVAIKFYRKKSIVLRPVEIECENSDGI